MCSGGVSILKFDSKKSNPLLCLAEPLFIEKFLKLQLFLNNVNLLISLLKLLRAFLVKLEDVNLNICINLFLNKIIK
jgi:hypothetical protein